jgi:hypothetical protein
VDRSARKTHLSSEVKTGETDLSHRETTFYPDNRFRFAVELESPGNLCCCLPQQTISTGTDTVADKQYILVQVSYVHGTVPYLYTHVHMYTYTHVYL